MTVWSDEYFNAQPIKKYVQDPKKELRQDWLVQWNVYGRIGWCNGMCTAGKTGCDKITSDGD